jgi:hypothetical protein
VTKSTFPTWRLHDMQRPEDGDSPGIGNGQAGEYCRVFISNLFSDVSETPVLSDTLESFPEQGIEGFVTYPKERVIQSQKKVF